MPGDMRDGERSKSPASSTHSRATSLSDVFEEKGYLTNNEAVVGNKLSIRSNVLFLLSASGSVLRDFISSIPLALVPSFLQGSPSPSSKVTLQPTAYLDGLRGVAAFIVFIHHAIIDWYPSLSAGYGTAPHNYKFIQLPIIRIFYSGRGMVSIFFVISGYVLSHKGLRLIRSAQYARLLDSLASSVFRRSMRLYFPLITSTFLSMLICHAGLYVYDPLRRNTIPQMLDTFAAQALDWWHAVVDITNPFQTVDAINLYSPPYDGHLWTIPIEFRGSMVVFITILCLAKVDEIIRMGILGALVAYTLWKAHWDLFLFLAGAIFADFGLRSLKSAQSTSDSILEMERGNYIVMGSAWSLKKAPERLHTASRQFAIIPLPVLAIFLLCIPDEAASSSIGYKTILEYTPKRYVDLEIIQRFWLAVGAFIFVASTASSRTLQKPFNTRFAQYLGRISYALYMVHGPVLYSFSTGMLAKVLAAAPVVEDMEGIGEQDQLTGNRTQEWRYGIAFLFTMILNVIAIIWAADIFWRVIDVKAAKLASWICDRCWLEE